MIATLIPLAIGACIALACILAFGDPESGDTCAICGKRITDAEYVVNWTSCADCFGAFFSAYFDAHPEPGDDLGEAAADVGGRDGLHGEIDK